MMELANDFKVTVNWGTWVAQSVKRLTLDLSSGFDLRIVSLSPSLGSTLDVKAT